MADPATRATSPAASTLQADLEAEAEVLQREIDEIALLLRQVRTEAERHRARRQQTGERVEALLAESGASGQLREAHAQLMLQAQRTVLMDAQVEVLEGKHKILQRFAANVAHTLERMRAGEAAGGVGSLPGAGGRADGDSRAVLAGQEEMRRQIARQMHDGPAQSIANIALQAEVVQRLLLADPAAGERELGELRQMVQHALEETKNFIFDVRPMVLDDLGLVPTLRRAAQDRARRTERRVRFESVGADRRLDAELESALFRIVDDAVGGYIESGADEVAVRLNWTDEAVSVTVSRLDAAAQAEPPGGGRQAVSGRQPSAGRQPVGGRQASAGRQPGEREQSLPPALAAMIQDQRHRDLTDPALPEVVFAAIRSRAAAVDVELTVNDEGRSLTATVRPA
ncbi:MAG: histidine kinase [Chloroflexota bacterium]|nr:histidine kinase [Chloroflexota bacterium]